MRPNEAAGKSILLRSNLTVHNTLRCHLYVFLETFHNADDLGNRVWKLLRPDQTYNIPLHLTNQSRIVLRPWLAGLVQAELHPNPNPNPNPNPDPTPTPTLALALALTRPSYTRTRPKTSPRGRPTTTASSPSNPHPTPTPTPTPDPTPTPGPNPDPNPNPNPSPDPDQASTPSTRATLAAASTPTTRARRGCTRRRSGHACSP